MESKSKPIKRNKRRRPPKKYRCELCERMVVKHEHIKVRKNYSHGKKSKAQVTHIHREDGGCLVELKSKHGRHKKAL